MFTCAVSPALWLINRYKIGFDGMTAYNRRWSSFSQEDLNGSLECTLERTLKLMNANGVFKVRMDADALGIDEVVAKDGTKIDVEVNAEEAALDQELRLSEPLLGMMKEMNSMKNFDACTEEQISEALDCRWVKDNMFAPTPSLVTVGLLLGVAVARNCGITLGDVSTAFLHAAVPGEVFIWPPKEFYPDGKCVWKLKKAMCGLRRQGLSTPSLKGSYDAMVQQPSVESIDSIGMLRVPLNDPVCVPSPKILFSLNEAIEWGYRATLAGT
ncbi:unnamed protein product, partial [Symbiodinium microadriaticum]